jgi:pimeloyl-ACP methyl ester carboxylesterase
VRTRDEGEIRFPPRIREVTEDRGDLDDHRHVLVETDRGTVETRFHEVHGAEAAVVLVGGVGGGFDEPAGALYDRVARALEREGISALRVRFRWPGVLDEAVHDVLAGVRLLGGHGARRIAVVGHSFGAAAAIAAAGPTPETAAVVALSPQAAGAGDVAALAGRPLLLVHGAQDQVLPPSVSVELFEAARAPKDLRIVDGAGHVLEEAADEVFELVRGFLREHLGAAEDRHPSP